jgi:hypothetical protein
MAHHMDYIELAWYVGVVLGGFRLLSQFIIKMIAIFASDKISKRAFEVLRIRWAKHAPSVLRDDNGGTSIPQNGDVD